MVLLPAAMVVSLLHSSTRLGRSTLPLHAGPANRLRQPSPARALESGDGGSAPPPPQAQPSPASPLPTSARHVWWRWSGVRRGGSPSPVHLLCFSASSIPSRLHPPHGGMSLPSVSARPCYRPRPKKTTGLSENSSWMWRPEVTATGRREGGVGTD